MKNTIKKFITCIGLVLIIILLLPVNASAGGKVSNNKVCPVAGCSRRVPSGYKYCYYHTCNKSGCTNKKANGSYCAKHASTKKKYDQYDVHSYKSSQDFADDKYEEFYDYEDDFEDEDEAYDAAEDYWNENH